jgi:hypothetical protein
MVRLIILLATLAIGLPFVVAYEAQRLGAAVFMRFLERPSSLGEIPYTIPPDSAAGEPLDPEALSKWVVGRRDRASGYSWRVIPLDIAYLLALGIFLGIASAVLAGMIAWPGVFPRLPTWLWWVLPVIYIVCDFAEDMFVIGLLNWPSIISASSLAVLAMFRSIKIGSVAFAIFQVLLLDGLAYIWTKASPS